MTEEHQSTEREENDDLIPCLLCNDGKLFKKKGGLRSHCTRRHKNEDCEFMFSQSESFDYKSFEEKISQ